MIFDKAISKTGSFFGRLKEAVRDTRQSLVGKIDEVIRGKKEISPELLDELEAVLLEADLGIATVDAVMEAAKEKMARHALDDVSQLRDVIRDQLLQILVGSGKGMEPFANTSAKPWVVFVVGVNGTGKTTTVGKLAHRMAREDRSVLICAADTFRAAAAEQVEIWAERSGAEIVRQNASGNPSAVLFDALQAAQARGTDVVLADTAGRLHTKSNLMQELDKMKRIAAKKMPGAPHEVLLVLDATTGQNGLVQAKEFTRMVGITGLVVTKLDGTAKGGVVFSIAKELGIPIRYAGIGEGIEDLVDFSAEEFVNSIFAA
jgi:fused signal recognition particle receptor